MVCLQSSVVCHYISFPSRSYRSSPHAPLANVHLHRIVGIVFSFSYFVLVKRNGNPFTENYGRFQ